ncbi:hypothetical protein TKWG_25684 (plasmid) [Advenella kashmirensis WT001]|uniref:Uncharacterized protein n=1 Tax=Advenella kashmirensis (strain DSM 17095 / LMG 22695 / WT001) TaxID=1036672 RepID=I3UI04_ADVKW|nr:hypothetical protein [Advenella kashmirensis]AFK64642.1 hypothetical protein TKWG_25684 [Advenella kashmirensis WT001]
MQTRTDELVNEVFTQTKQKLSPDDPLLSLILLQEKSLQRAFEQQNISRADQDQAFLAQLDERLVKINAMAADLAQYRERVIAELLAKNQQVAVQIEGRVVRRALGGVQRLRVLAGVALAVAVFSLAGVGMMYFQMRG